MEKTLEILKKNWRNVSKTIYKECDYQDIVNVKEIIKTMNSFNDFYDLNFKKIMDNKILLSITYWNWWKLSDKAVNLITALFANVANIEYGSLCYWCSNEYCGNCDGHDDYKITIEFEYKVANLIEFDNVLKELERCLSYLNSEVASLQMFFKVFEMEFNNWLNKDREKHAILNNYK